MSQRTVMPYSATPPKPGHDALVEDPRAARRRRGSRGRQRARRSPRRRRCRRSGSILRPSIADHGVAVVHQMMREREARRARARRPAPCGRSRAAAAGGGGRADSSASAANRSRSPRAAPARPSGCASRPAECRPAPASDRCRPSCSRCRCDARSPPSSGCRRRRWRARRSRWPLRSQRVHLGDLFLERAARQRHAERRLLECAGLAILQALASSESLPWLWHQMQ